MLSTHKEGAERVCKGLRPYLEKNVEEIKMRDATWEHQVQCLKFADGCEKICCSRWHLRAVVLSSSVMRSRVSQRERWEDGI